MNEHTPGPWSAGGIYVSGPSGYVVAEVDSHDTARRERRKNAPPLVTAYANARLIAAAPDMLEALRGIAAFDDSEYENDSIIAFRWRAVEIAREAINKADRSNR